MMARSSWVCWICLRTLAKLSRQYFSSLTGVTTFGDDAEASFAAGVFSAGGGPITETDPAAGVLSLVKPLPALGASFLCSRALRAASATDWPDCCARASSGTRNSNPAAVIQSILRMAIGAQWFEGKNRPRQFRCRPGERQSQ